MAIYGIDLGTTFCSVAYLEGGYPKVVPLEGGRPTLASVALFTTDRDGRPVAAVGRAARAKYRELLGGADAPPDGVVLVRGSKNYIGVAGEVTGGPPWRVGGRELYSTDVAAVILRAIAGLVRAQPGLAPVEGVVVTHPQRFRNSEKLATAQAVRMAGLPLVGMITEPDAAAWAYGVHERAEGPRTFMVFDFGGGTLDVTIMRGEGGGAEGAGGRPVIRAVGSYGVQLGGLQIDERIRDGLVTKLEQQRAGVALEGMNEATRERLLELAEAFKVDLNRDASSDPAPMMRSRAKAFRAVRDDGAEGAEAKLKVTLGELSGWIAGEVDRAVTCADEALRRAGVAWGDLDEVLLTGGSSQLVALQQRMRERCPGKVRVVYDDQDHPLRPSTIVALGAALYGASLARGGERPGVDVRGVVPDAFAIRAYRSDPAAPGGRRAVLHTLVPAGTPTPHVGTGYFAMRGGGRVLPVQVFEGRSETEASCVGTFHLEFDHDVPDGARVEVQLRVLANGALVLAVQDRRSGTWREAPLNEAPGLYSDDELADRTRWLQWIALETE